MNEKPHKRFYEGNFQNNLLAGLLTIIPLAVVWMVLSFFLTLLADAGRPMAEGVTTFLARNFPALAPLAQSETVRAVIGILVALLALYVIGAVAGRVVGQKLIEWFERGIARIPLVETVYSAAKKLIDVLHQKPGSNQRVVLIDFPREGVKTIGFVMRTFPDAQTGEEIAAVYVPTAPNPTSGYLQLLPMSKLVATDMGTDQAMTMILSGGAVTPAGISLKAGP
ncbi:MAG TPA: DUF502 domain-containing protein [Rhizomicrobium sp.]